MGYDKYGVVKVRNADPELFWIVFADSSMAKDNPMLKFSDDFDEKGVRAELAKMGLSAPKINDLIATARANPK
jgi:hypothetical protein